MTAVAERNPFFVDAIEAFGFEGAKELSGRIVSSSHNATTALAEYGLMPPPGLKLMVVETGSYVNAFADVRQGVAQLNFSPSAIKQTDRLFNDTERLIWHEFAHIFHARLYPPLFNIACNDKDALFAFTLQEGFADYVTDSRHSEYERTDPATDIPEKMYEEIVTTLGVIIYDPPKNDTGNPYAFHRGQLGLPYTAYELGHFMVAAMASDRDLSIGDLARTPLEKYKDYVENCLL